MIIISDCPITGLQRKVVKKNLFFFETNERLILECIISHFKGDVLVENSRIKNYTVSLIADNTTFVNGENGDYVDAKDKNAIGQFDFFVLLQNVAVKQSDLIAQHIIRADNNKRFDI
jgi:hypothetical protein